MKSKSMKTPGNLTLILRATPTKKERHGEEVCINLILDKKRKKEKSSLFFQDDALAPPAGGEGDGWGELEIEGIDIPDTHVHAPGKGEVAYYKVESSQAYLTPLSLQSYFVPPNPGPSSGQIWIRNSRLAADHAAAGGVGIESAMQVSKFCVSG